MSEIDEDELELYTVYNSDGSKLEFTGEIIAHVSAELPEKPRWTEFTWYITSFDTWILQGVGKSRVTGEKDLFWYVVSSDMADVLDKILGSDASRLAKRLLRDGIHFLKDCEECPDVG